jgi:hypothetical protein
MALIETILVDGQNDSKSALRDYLADREIMLPVAGDMEMQTGAVLRIQPAVSTVGLGFVGDPTESGMNWIHEGAFGFMSEGNQVMTFHDSGVFIADANGMRCIIGSPDSYTSDNGQKFEIAGNGNATGGLTATYFSAGDSNSPLFILQKSASGTLGTHAAVISTEVLGGIAARGSDGTSFNNAATIDFTVGSVVATGKVPGNIDFNNADAATGTWTAPTCRFAYDGAVYFPRMGTTVSAANVYIDNATTPANKALRSTSTEAFKHRVHVLVDDEIAAFERLAPKSFSSLHWDDDPRQEHLGFMAEECFAIDPRLAIVRDGVPDGVSDRALLALTVAYVQQLAREVRAPQQGG